MVHFYSLGAYLGICLLFIAGCSENTPKSSKFEVPAAQNQDRNVDDRIHALATPLTVTAPPDLTQKATGALTDVVLGAPDVLNSVGNLSISNDAPNNGFPVGDTVVTWSVTDEGGHVASASQTVSIEADIACSTQQLFFKQRIWPILNQYCLECHDGVTVSSSLNFIKASVPGYINTNYQEMMRNSLLLDNSNLSVFLSKTINRENSHTGGEILKENSLDYQLLASMVDRFSLCAGTNSVSNLQIVGPLQQLRKTALALVSRLPALSEISSVNNAVTDIEARQVVKSIVKVMLTESAFYQRLKEIYNSLLLTDAFKANANALSLNLDDFDNKNYFGNTELMQQGYNGTDSNVIRSFASDGISQSPLELVVYVVKNNYPFTEILNADYVMVNAYSATIFGAVIPGENNFNFRYGQDWQSVDPTRFLPAKLVDNKSRNLPHAGILTTLAFLSRYPSTSTNLNRKRAKYIFEYFLDTNVEGLADRGALDLGKLIGNYPILEDPQCSICHNLVDPIAGLFKNWDAEGRFLGDNLNWFDKRTPPQMLSPGYSNSAVDILSDSSSGAALQWLANRISRDNRFITATVKLLFREITGIESPIDTRVLQSLKNIFINTNYNLKAVIEEIVSSDYFLATNLTTQSPVIKIDNIGTAHRLGPEQLNRKISAVFDGYEWIAPSKQNLLSIDTYRLLYGGIDSIEVITNSSQQTGITAGVQARIATQTACQITPLDFIKPPTQRILFPFVSVNTIPDNAQQTQLIKQNIEYLVNRILGLNLISPNSEIERIYKLFNESIVFSGNQPLVEECRGSLLADDVIVIDQQRTIHAWIAVLNYLIRDYYFLYE